MQIHPKVQAMGVAGALAVVVFLTLKACHVTVDPTLAEAITVLCGVAAGYLKSS